MQRRIASGCLTVDERTNVQKFALIGYRRAVPILGPLLYRTPDALDRQSQQMQNCGVELRGSEKEVIVIGLPETAWTEGVPDHSSQTECDDRDPRVFIDRTRSGVV